MELTLSRLFVAVMIILSALGALGFQQSRKQHVKYDELGNVEWLRNHDMAFEESRKTGKPVLILFQEVPGCAGCKQYGGSVLRDQTIVDAIENHFVPLAVFNNRGGQDRELLEHYGEPAWNYQVMRFFDSKGRELISRKDRIWTLSQTAQRMALSLEKAGRAIPESLLNLKE